MTETVAKNEILAAWQCEADLWRAFLASESELYPRTSRSAFHFMVVTAVLTAVIAGLIFGINSFALRGKMADATGPAIAVLAIGGLCSGIGLLIWLLRRQKDAAFLTGAGQIEIRTDGVTTNGLRFDWTFDGGSPRFVGCRRNKATGQIGSAFEIIEFESRVEIPGRPAPIVDIVRWRVPVPTGEIVAADAAMQKLNSLAAAIEP